MQGYTLFSLSLSLSLSSYCSCSNLFFLIFCGGFIWKFSSFIYSHASCILTLHLQSSSSSIGHLSHQTPVECGRRSCLAVNMLFRVHFLINAADEIVANHLMRRQQVSFHRKLLSTTLTLSLNAILSVQISRRYFVSSPPLHRRPHSLGLKCFHPRNERWSQWFYPSSVLGPPQSGSSLILACRSQLQIRISGLGHDSSSLQFSRTNLGSLKKQQLKQKLAQNLGTKNVFSSMF